MKRTGLIMHGHALPFATRANYPAYTIRNRPQSLLVTALRGSSVYDSLAAYISDVFQKTYSATIEVTYPVLMGLVDAEGYPLAALGMRRADDSSPLFLERYLDASVESCVQTVLGQAVPRHAIAEVGNLASSGRSDIFRLLYNMTLHLDQEAVSHILFTGTASLKRYLHNLNLYPQVLAEANPARLGGEVSRWGSYYESCPKVMVGTVSHRHEVLPRQTDMKVKKLWP